MYHIFRGLKVETEDETEILKVSFSKILYFETDTHNVGNFFKTKSKSRIFYMSINHSTFIESLYSKILVYILQFSLKSVIFLEFGLHINNYFH